MEPGPSTIRPHTPNEDLAARLAHSKARTFIVTDAGRKAARRRSARRRGRVSLMTLHS
jgi:hypothetical protein